ncbi:hypothetical protein [Tomitella gaofuii]|uniref:hypothetical protein n=1 Tax=Tomitella gaofuii TaxID=2760083 RepID=UPI0015F7F66B|nr:hypothetical protein [Tomitella gaofuii]
MAITARLVGKLGGGMEQTPVTDSSYGSSWKTICEVTVPDGETWVVVGDGVLDSGRSTRTAYFRVGGSLSQEASGSASVTAASVVTGPEAVRVQISGGSSVTTASFDGTVYAAKVS